MKTFFTLLFLAGTCTGLQYPLQYLYHYRAGVVAGIPEINKHHKATSAIRANLRVYVTSPQTIAFRLEDVEFAEYHGEVECSSTPGELPVEYVTAWEEPGSLLGQHAFGLNEQGHFVHHESEPKWVLNFYKSIVGIFNISPLRNTFYGTYNDSQASAYTDVEDTVMGHCQTTYTDHKLVGVGKAKYEHFYEDHIEEDPQLDESCGAASPLTSKGPGKGRKVRSTKTRKTTKTTGSKTSSTVNCDVPNINSDVSRIVRSVNLEECIERVEHQLTMGSVYCSLGEDQCKNLYSRNSHGIYYVRGDNNGMRLEKAKIKGAIVVSPYGYETEHLKTVTKQKVALVSVEKLQGNHPDCSQGTCVEASTLTASLVTPYQENYVDSYKWAEKGTMREVMDSLTGSHSDEASQKQNEARVIKLVNAAGQLASSDDLMESQGAPVMLNYAATLMYPFTLDQLLNVFSFIAPENYPLMYDVLVDVGSKPAIRMIIEVMRSNQLSDIKQVFFYGSLNNNLKEASALKLVMDHILSEDMDAHPFRTSQAVINFASVVRRYCLSSGGRTDSFVVFAHEQCRQDHIVEHFQEFLISELSTATSFWKQMALVEALVNLKTVESTNALLPFILGQKECDPLVRAVAMESLASWNAANRLHKDKITLILLDIFENPGENRLLRARALAFLSSWPLSSTAWTRLALATKKSGLKDLSALTYSLIKTTSEYAHPEMIRQRQYAQHALTLAKPSSTGSRYSSFQTWFRYCFRSQIGGVDHTADIIDPTSPLPADFSVYVRRALGGVVFHRKLELMMAHNYGDLEDIAIQLFLDKHRPPRRGQISNYFLSMLRANLDIEEKVRGAVNGLASITPLRDMQLFVPLDHIFLSDLMKAISGDAAPYLSVNGPRSLYVNTIDFYFTTVNDIGLPVITNVARPSLMHFNGHLDFSNSGSNEFTFSTRDYSDYYTTFLRVNIETTVPWMHSKLATGVAHSFGVGLPMSPTVVVHTKDDDDYNKGIDITLRPVTQEAVVLMKTNQPYTILHDAAPSDLSVLQSQLKTVQAVPSDRKFTDSVSNPLGIDYSFIGDFHHKLNFVKLMSSDVKEFEKWGLAPTLKFFMMKADFKVPTESFDTTEYKFSVTMDHLHRNSKSGRYITRYGQDSYEDYEICGQEQAAGFTQQTTGGQVQDEDLWGGQQSTDDFSGADAEYESFGSFGTQQVQQQPQKLTEYEETEAELNRPSQQFGDVMQPQLSPFMRKLRQNTGWNHRIDGLSIRGEVLVGGEVKSASEVVHAKTSCYGLKDQILTKNVIVYDRAPQTCAMACVESEVISPKITAFDTLELLYQRNLTKTINYHVYTGDHCSFGPVISQRQQESLSENGLEKLKADMQHAQDCTGPAFDPLQTFYEKAEYDTYFGFSNITDFTTWQCPSYAIGFVGDVLVKKIFMDEYLGVKLPDICKFENGVWEGTIKSHRNEDGSYNSYFNDRLFIDHKHMREPKRSLFALLLDSMSIELRRPMIRKNYDTEPLRDYCAINSDSIKTFDDLVVNTTLDGQCGSLAVTSCEEGFRNLFAISVKKTASGSVTAHVADEVTGVSISIGENGISVNNKAMEENKYFQEIRGTRRGYSRESALVRLYKRDGKFIAEIPNTANILYKGGSIFISVDDRMRGYLCGLCGDNDMNSMNDMKTPEGCLLTAPDHFLSSWRPTSGFECVTEKLVDPDTCIREEPLPADYYAQYQL